MDSCLAKLPSTEKDGRILVGEGVNFERIRRIALLSMPVRLALLANGHGASHRHSVATGYLVGTLDRFNDAKRAEERDRVKHFGGGEDSPAWMRGAAQRPQPLPQSGLRMGRAALSKPQLACGEATQSAAQDVRPRGMVL